MGIKFRCHGCDNKLHVKAYLAGKRGVCPHCGAKVRIPPADEERGEESATEGSSRRKNTSAQTATAAKPASGTAAPVETATEKERSATPSTEPAPEADDPIAAAPEAVWYVRPPSGGQYGPADGEIMRRWLEEGRISAESLVWREGWSDWQTGESAFPSLRRTPPTTGGPASERGELPGKSSPSDFDFDGGRAAERVTKKRVSSKSNGWGIAIVVTLSLVCVGLLVGLWLVLN